MKIDKKTLITVLGWEDRFKDGIVEILEKFEVSKIILVCFNDYLYMENMESNLKAINELSYKKKVEIEFIKLNYNDSISNWNILESFFIESSDNYLLNITTIPRETIWVLFFFLRKLVKSINYIYFKPTAYCKEWLTKNHKSPRLLFKHSGIFDLNKDLALFVIAGFDYTRLNQIIEFYEPNKIVIFYQNGKQFENIDRNKSFENYISRSSKFCEIVEINTYDVTGTSKILLLKYEEYKDKYNIIIDSQGPKLSALSVYDVYMKSESKISLAYVAAKDFNLNYSSGIDLDFIVGEFVFN